FVFAKLWVGVASSLMVVFISLIEILVAAIQAYVFTLFSSLYIGMATAEHEHH
ncbi:MAG: F0F1 ATP synthase subunit A, partial [Bacteroidota bacterium]|nr:F0F1 ATP synthase subunit A [Bacteroidota bacterium]